MFLGEYEYSLDDRSRVALPPRFRDEFKAGLVLARGLDRCISVYTPGSWQKLTSRLEAMPFEDEATRKLQRSVFSQAYEAELDRQGRVLLPNPLRTFAEIRQGVVVIGMNDHAELWATELWTEERASLDARRS